MAAGKKQSGKDAMAVINEHIKNESYAPVYLLYGDETYLVNQYRDKLLSAVTDREDNMNFAKFAGEGAMQAVSTITGIAFPKVKIGFDCSMVIISLVTCLIAIHSVGSVGIGTVMAAILVGFVLGLVTKAFGTWRDHLYYGRIS